MYPPQIGHLLSAQNKKKTPEGVFFACYVLRRSSAPDAISRVILATDEQCRRYT
jgi:hypothetical protein